MVTTARYAGPRRRWPLVVAAVIVGLVVLFTALAGYVTDLLWFREVGSPSSSGPCSARGAPGALFGLVFVSRCTSTCDRAVAPPATRPHPRQEAVERVRQSLEPYLRGSSRSAPPRSR